MSTLLVTNATFLTQDPVQPVVRGSLVARDGVIEAVGADARAPDADEVLDARGGLVTPGLVNAHAHSGMTLLRGLGDDLPLETWLRTRIWPAEATLTEDEVRAGTELAILEMLASGTTTVNEMYFFADAAADAFMRAGMRAVVGVAFLDFATPEMPPEAMVDYAHGFVARWADRSPLVHPALAPHATYTCGPETLDAVAAVRDAHARAVAGRAPLVHTHCAETRHEVQDVEARRGARPYALLEKHALVDRGTVLAHCGWITKAEVRAIARAGAAVAHCPVSNMKLATGGWLPFPELDEAGALVALGTDGAASNNTLDVLETAKFAALAQKQHRWDAEAVPASRALRLATLDGARALRLAPRAGEEDAWHAGDAPAPVGRLAPGWMADLVVWRTDRPGLAPLHDPVSQLVYAARGTDAAATVVAGRVVYEDGVFHTVDAARVLTDAERAAARLAAAVRDA